MTKEEKELLLKDICARIPNHVKVELHGEICTCLGYFDDFVMLTSNTPRGQQMTNVANVKPYLRPMGSMTEEESRELGELITIYDDVDWMLAHHFDVHNLIEKGLALEAKEGMYSM